MPRRPRTPHAGRPPADATIASPLAPSRSSDAQASASEDAQPKNRNEPLTKPAPKPRRTPTRSLAPEEHAPDRDEQAAVSARPAMMLEEQVRITEPSASAQKRHSRAGGTQADAAQGRSSGSCGRALEAATSAKGVLVSGPTFRKAGERNPGDLVERCRRKIPCVAGLTLSNTGIGLGIFRLDRTTSSPRSPPRAQTSVARRNAWRPASASLRPEARPESACAWPSRLLKKSGAFADEA
jgi:hypothetical protein